MLLGGMEGMERRVRAFQTSHESFGDSLSFVGNVVVSDPSLAT